MLFNFVVEFYLGYLFVFLFLLSYAFKLKGIRIPRVLIAVFSIFFLTAVIEIFRGNNYWILLLKQAAGFLFIGTAYYLLVRVNDYDVKKLFSIYLKLAFVVSVIGLMQEAFFLLFKAYGDSVPALRHGYDYGFFIKKWAPMYTSMGVIRVNSIFTESSHYAVTMAPAYFAALISLCKKGPGLLARWMCVFIIAGYLLTMSAVAYIAVVLSFFMLFFLLGRKYIIAGGIVLVSLVAGSYLFNVEIRMRVNDSVSVCRNELSAADSHLSVYALASNAYVAYKSLTENPLFGHGLGSHPVTYDRHIRAGESRGFWSEKATVVNQKDAGSLFLRLLSETGLFGTVIFMVFIFKYRIRIGFSDPYQIINNSIFLLIVLQLFRQGNFFYNGFPFFMFVYYYSSLIYEKNNRDIGG